MRVGQATVSSCIGQHAKDSTVCMYETKHKTLNQQL